MKIRNISVINPKIFTNDIINYLIKNNVSYVLIKDDDYYELHVLDMIIRISNMTKVKDQASINLSTSIKKERQGLKTYSKQMKMRDNKKYKANINKK